MTCHSELTHAPFTPKGVRGLTQWGNSCVDRMTHAPCRLWGAAGQGASVPHPRDAHMRVLALQYEQSRNLKQKKMDDYRRIELGGQLTEQLTALWLAEGADLLDFEMIICQTMAFQIHGAAKDYNKDPVELANIIHHGIVKLISKIK